jgi:hypothetical protein
MKQKTEFSKKILMCTALGTVLIVLFGCYMAWITKDMSIFAYLIPAVFTELTVGTGFYYRKAQAENEIKLQLGVDGYGEGCSTPTSGTTSEMQTIGFGVPETRD